MQSQQVELDADQIQMHQIDLKLFRQIINEEINKNEIILIKSEESDEDKNPYDPALQAQKINIAQRSSEQSQSQKKIPQPKLNLKKKQQYQPQDINIKKMSHSALLQIQDNQQPSKQRYRFEFADLQYFEYKEQVQLQRDESSFNAKERILFELNVLIQHSKVIFSYLRKLLKNEKILLILVFLGSIGLIYMTSKLEYDERCDFRKMKANYIQYDIIKCPVLQYFQVHTGNMLSFFLFQQFNLYLMIFNCQQISKRRLMVDISLVVFILYIFQKGWRKFMRWEYVFEPIRGLALIFLILAFKFYSKHKLGIQIVKIIFILIFIIFVLLGLAFSVANLEQYDSQKQFIIQYITYFLKKLVFYQVKWRIKRRLFYDDLTVLLTLLYIMDYIFIFRQFLILDILQINRLISLTNFIIIQAQNIVNVNIVYEIYQNCLKKKLLLVKNILIAFYAIKLIIRVTQTIQKFFIQIVVAILSTTLAKALKFYFQNDNPEAITKRDRNLELNKYHNYSIEEDQIKIYFSQQAILACFYFLIYQLLLIFNETQNPPEYNYPHLFIHKTKQNQYKNYNLNNLITFNILFNLFTIVLLLNKKFVEFKVMNQMTHSQSFVVRLFILIGLQSQINQLCFYYPQSITYQIVYEKQ